MRLGMVQRILSASCLKRLNLRPIRSGPDLFISLQLPPFDKSLGLPSAKDKFILNELIYSINIGYGVQLFGKLTELCRDCKTDAKAERGLT